ncbi:MAG TPA: hydroxyisourate hydrolase [Terriglobales bacterium]|nr:hydroxyisourate hydrolase [Terriglobales bacterium]
MAHEKIGISTHVLDIARGKPAAGIPVQLERCEAPEHWQKVGAGRTDHDGRCEHLLPASVDLAPGTYRLIFHIASYHSQLGADALHPVVQITFLVRDGEKHLHLPLLLSPNGYTTYRGS